MLDSVVSRHNNYCTQAQQSFTTQTSIVVHKKNILVGKIVMQSSDILGTSGKVMEIHGKSWKVMEKFVAMEKSWRITKISIVLEKLVFYPNMH